MRLDRLLANMGFGTRKEVKKAIKEGLARVNNETITDPGFKLDPEEDEVVFFGIEVVYREFIYLMLNKPKGYVSSTDDPVHPSVLELIDPYYYIFQPHLVGRLDLDTRGLLIITNDGPLTHQLTSPRRGVMKLYEAYIDSRVTEREVDLFKQGLYIGEGDYTSLPAELEILERGRTSLVRLGIREGKYHQVKNMFRAVGMEVLDLKRIAMGGLYLDEDLEEGDYRELTQEEVSLLKEGQEA